MSAWYIFSAMGFYPVNPVSGEYVIGSYEITFFTFFVCFDILLTRFFRPFFERISIDLNPSSSNPFVTPKKLTITAIGARSKPYIKSLTINGISITQPVIKHEQIANGAEMIFEMSEQIETWGNDESVLKAFGVVVGSDISSSSKVSIRDDGIYDVDSSNHDEL
jgi:putative alpha-1,2-mannosidase